MAKSSKEPKWKEFEKIVAYIHKDLTPDAVVKHNDFVKGKSGRRRQLDVTITSKVGTYPIFIVIECKHYKNDAPVGIEKVEAFAKKLDDVSASRPGVIISTSGFDDGARAIAKTENIMLLTYREAEMADWQKLFGTDSWVVLFLTSAESWEATITFSEDAENVSPSFSDPIYDANGDEICTVEKLLADAWETFKQGGFNRDAFGKTINLNIETNDNAPCFMGDSASRHMVKHFVFSGHLIAKKYIVNTVVERARLFENDQDKEIEYGQVLSNELDWIHIMNTQAGIELTPEEFDAMIDDSKPERFFMLEINNPQFRVQMNFKPKS